MDRIQTRESNYELLRCLAMFMVLVLHANFVSLDIPSVSGMYHSLGSFFSRFFLESLSIVGVNVFILLSGWFGIHVSKERFLSLIYTILFFFGGGYILAMILGKDVLNIRSLAEVFLQTRYDWFIKSYIVLYILSPVLNSFCESADRKVFAGVVIAYISFEILYGWVGGATRFFVHGYGPLHFIGLYLLARFFRREDLIGRMTGISKIYFFLAYLILAVCNTALVWGLSFYSKDARWISRLVFSYNNPIVLLGSLSLFLFFSKCRINHSSFINWLGVSSFSVYLFHSIPLVRQHIFTPVIQYLYFNYCGWTGFFLISFFLCLVFIVSILLDQFRILSWRSLIQCFNR